MHDIIRRGSIIVAMIVYLCYMAWLVTSGYDFINAEYLSQYSHRLVGGLFAIVPILTAVLYGMMHRIFPYQKWWMIVLWMTHLVLSQIVFFDTVSMGSFFADISSFLSVVMVLLLAFDTMVSPAVIAKQEEAELEIIEV